MDKQRIILCRRESVDDIVDELLKDSDYIGDVEVKSIDSFISSFLNEKIKLVELKKICEDLKLTKFLSNVQENDMGFFNEALKINDEIEKYDLALEDLKIETELKIIIDALPKRGYQKMLAEIKENDYSNLEISEEVFDLFQEKIINLLKEKGAKTYAYPKVNEKHKEYLVGSYESENDDKQVEYANATVVDQYETAIQYILKKEKDNPDFSKYAFVLCDYSHFDLLENVLKRYNIPYCPQAKTISLKTKQLLALLKYCQNQSIENYFNIISLNIFNKENYQQEELYTYLKWHLDEKGIEKEFNRINEKLKETSDENQNRTIREYKKREKIAERYRSQTSDKLKELINLSTLKERIEKAFSYISEDNEYQDDLRQLAYFLQDRGEYIKSEEYLPFLINELESFYQKDISNNGIYIAKLFENIYRDYIFVFDATSDNLPPSIGKKGILNEEVLLNSKYPSFDERYENTNRLLDYLAYSKETYYYYASGNYDGHENKISFYLKKRISEGKCKHLKQDLTHYQKQLNKKEYVLNEDNAKEAFENLRWSVSAIEDYSQCPYFFFLNRVLKLYDSEENGLDYIKIGNIMHKLVENDINNITKMSEADIKDALSTAMSDIAILYPKYKQAYEYTYNQCLNVLLELKEYYRNISDTYKVYKTEYEADSKLELSNKEEIQFKVKIDRIDTNEDYFRIIDYKTSDHSISEVEFKKGKQLQLLTYAFLYEKESKKNLSGIYYFMLNGFLYSLNTKEKSLYSYEHKKGIYMNDVDYEKVLKDKNLLKGISFEKDEKKVMAEDGVLSPYSTVWDKDKTRDALTTIYDKLYQDIRDGKYPLIADEKAIDYNKTLARICEAKDYISENNELLYTDSLKPDKKEEK